MNEVKVKISGGGRVVIPIEFRKSLNLQEGDELILRIEQGELRLLTKQQAIRHAQQTISQYVSKGRSLSDELIAERQKEYERE